ncbi:helix-turn-helix domain-containing protein [Evansella sp. LMS18]|uniref:helix-turn-helix domain-containing protein n=1 Tax=Evansella sp. LMS18 TaxID=2924033 RepID=UPI0020D0F291|nr:helix-turn-helix domain-containing protein [Evansella sp. LMS18]UTR09591.1 helix-turn-helix domain-containing protein [Evansella sp. LMS18]
MSCLEWIILTLINRVNGQRTSGGVYHLLTGKRSAQTIQDARLFDCYKIAGSVKTLSRERFEDSVSHMLKQGVLSESEENFYILTSKGREALQTLDRKYKLPPYFNGGKYEWSGLASIYWDRFSLFFQTLASFTVNEKQFIPVSYRLDTQRWVKQKIRELRQPAAAASEQLYNELVDFLQQLPEREAELFVSRLTAPGHTGRTFDQLSYMYAGDALYTKLFFQSVLHLLLKSTEEKPGKYPFLQSFAEMEKGKQILTASAEETSKLLKKGKTLEEIMEVRGLKRSTIEDHLIEIAIYGDSNVSKQLISEEETSVILQAAEETGSKRLKQIKDNLGGEYSYFQIRLALARQRER